MAFETYATKQQGVHRGVSLLYEIRQIYLAGKVVQGKLADYLAATDPALNATINALFSAAERTEINAMLLQINDLIADWETNHPDAIGL